MARQLDGMDISKLRAGNQQAVRQWFEQYADPLYALVFFKVGRDADAGSKNISAEESVELEKASFQ
jgi:hypothetical protein